MRLKKKFDESLALLKKLEGEQAQKVKNGSKDPADFLEMSYLSGLLNGYKFVWYVIDHSDTVRESDFDELFNKILHKETVN